MEIYLMISIVCIQERFNFTMTLQSLHDGVNVKTKVQGIDPVGVLNRFQILVTTVVDVPKYPGSDVTVDGKVPQAIQFEYMDRDDGLDGFSRVKNSKPP